MLRITSLNWAQQLHPELPENLKRLAWLELDSQEGKDYWEAMELCGKYAEANHELIHESVIGALGWAYWVL